MKTFKEFQSISEAYKDPDTNKMLNKRKHIAIHVLDPKSDNETYDKVGGRMLKIGKEKRKFESDPDLYALDKMSQSATNATREKKRSKKVEEAYKDPNLDKIQNKIDKVVSTGKQSGFEHMKQGRREKGQKIINRAVERVYMLDQVKKQFEKQPDLYALDRMAKVPLVKKRQKIS
jgi:hypothetical protein